MALTTQKFYDIMFDSIEETGFVKNCILQGENLILGVDPIIDFDFFDDSIKLMQNKFKEYNLYKDNTYQFKEDIFSNELSENNIYTLSKFKNFSNALSPFKTQGYYTFPFDIACSKSKTKFRDIKKLYLGIELQFKNVHKLQYKMDFIRSYSTMKTSKKNFC